VATLWRRDPCALLATALTVHRVTRLLTVDEFPPVEAARAWLEHRLPDDYRHGVTCAWCVSWWVAVAAVAIAEGLTRRYGPRRGRDRWLLLALPWALSSTAGLLAERETA
jgi:hypothetical protein